jgi:hypothetical protein
MRNNYKQIKIIKMKNKYISVLAIGMFLLPLSSCEDFMDIHKEYVEDGETIYAPKLDAITFIAGEGRILFQGLLINSPNVKTVTVSWNDGNNSHPITVPSSSNDTVLIEEFLPNMEEGTYTFEVRTTDSKGHQSLKQSDVGTSYGALFRSTLSQRYVEIKVNDHQLSQALISGGITTNELVGTEVRYTATGNTQKVVWLSPDVSIDTIKDLDDLSSLEYRSLYLPEETARDTFKLDWEPITPLAVYTAWTVAAYSTAQSTTPAARIIDGNLTLTSLWHSQWSGAPTLVRPGNEPPHWVIIDMVTPKNISNIDTYSGNNGSVAAPVTATKTVQYVVRDVPTLPGSYQAPPALDPETLGWVKIGEDIEFPTIPQMLPLNIPTPNPAHKKRYLLLYLPDSHSVAPTNMHVQIAEVVVTAYY